MGVVLGALAVVVVAYAIYWQRSLTEKKMSAGSPPGKTMIVVLPFENLGPSDVEYFTDGVTEEITSRLAALSGLGVISRTSAIQYKGANKSIKQIGEELGVDYVLEGSVRWDKPAEGESRVRVTPKLIRVADDTHLWSEQFDRVLEDIFAVQSEIASHVIEQLNVTLLEPEREVLAARPTGNMEAYQAYLRGRDYAGRAGFSIERWRLAFEMYERAVELDPDFALAYTALGYAHSQVYNLGIERTQLHADKAKAAVDRAIELQPELPEAHLAMGYYYYHCLRDYERALESFTAAGERLPNQNEILQHIGYIRRRQSRWDEAVDLMKRSLELNPRDASLCREIGHARLAMRSYEEALEYYNRSIEIEPDQVETYVFKAWAYWLKSGDVERGRATLAEVPYKNHPIVVLFSYWQAMFERDYQAAADLIAASPIELFELPTVVMSKSYLAGYAYEVLGDKERATNAYESARSILEQAVAERPDDARLLSELGVVLAALGHKDDAIREGKLAVEMIPVSTDALAGPRQIENLAEIYVRVGDYDDAIEQIDYLLSIPAYISVSSLRNMPLWNPLRDNAKFQAVLEKHSKRSS
jgi:TolB-like protein/Flp pilus assembly protein TadD